MTDGIRSGLDYQWQVGYYTQPHVDRITPQDHTSELYFFDDESDAVAYCESLLSRGYAYDIILTSPGPTDTWTLDKDGWT